MSKKKLVIVTTVPDTIASILKYQPRFLNEFYNVVLVTSPGPLGAVVEANEGIKPIYIPMVRGISPFKDLWSIFKMYLLLSSLKPDAVHSYTPKAGLIAMVSAFLAMVPVRIHTFTGLIFPTQSGVRKKILILVDRLICRCATTVIPEGEGVRQDLIRYSITAKPLKVIGSGNIAGVDVEFFSRGETKAGGTVSPHVNLDPFNFCFIGRLNKDKGIRELSIAFGKLPENARLTIVGGVDPSAPVDAGTMDALTNDPRVKLIGYLEDVRPVLESSHVLVLPSYREGFPNVLLEAGAMGLPVIATDINGSNEIVENDYNGWLVAPQDACELQSAMEHVMTLSVADILRVGRNARERVVERFERNDYLKNLVCFYSQVIISQLKSERCR